mgnify:CR=1 FL=1
MCENSLLIYPTAIGCFCVGLNNPDVIRPIGTEEVPLSKSWVSVLMGAFPRGTNPTNLYSVPFFISDNIVLAPGKLPSFCPLLNLDLC